MSKKERIDYNGRRILMLEQQVICLRNDIEGKGGYKEQIAVLKADYEKSQEERANYLATAMEQLYVIDDCKKALLDLLRLYILEKWKNFPLTLLRPVTDPGRLEAAGGCRESDILSSKLDDGERTKDNGTDPTPERRSSD